MCGNELAWVRAGYRGARRCTRRVWMTAFSPLCASTAAPRSTQARLSSALTDYPVLL